jgi:hypothetical protein
MEDKPILKKTVYTVAVMLAAWATFVGTLSFLAVFVTSHVVGGGARDESSAADTAAAIHANEPATGRLPTIPHANKTSAGASAPNAHAGTQI